VKPSVLLALIAGLSFLSWPPAIADVRSVRLSIALNCPYGLAG